MQKMNFVVLAAACSAILVGCGDITVNQPARPNVIVEEKHDRPVIIEKKTVVENNPVVVEHDRVIPPHKDEKINIEINKH